jgi:beta-lactamase regulating signal transducer with metallopeptidase domain
MLGAKPIVLDGWTRPAFVIESTFPIVAVVGIWRPRLIIARHVLNSCSSEELRAVLAHEQGHAERRDNLGRLLMAVTPDVISWLPFSKRIALAWHEAAEEAADECADALGPRGRLLLAEALIRVARMAPSEPPVAVPASALYRGENIERRVRRLLSPLAPVTIRWSRTERRLGRAAFILGCVLALQGVYEIVEAAVTFLP